MGVLIYCLFEQSGVFKNAFKKLGFAAVDIDLRDDFKQTDRVLNLFNEIEKASLYGNCQGSLELPSAKSGGREFQPCYFLTLFFF